MRVTPVDVLWWARIELYMRGVRHLPKRLRRIVYYRLLRLHNYRGSRRARSRTVWGGTMWLKPGDYVDDYILCDGVWEPHVVAQLEAKLAGEGWFFDVGAHIGSCTLAAAKILGPRGRVVAFEPTPTTFMRLVENIELNGADNVTLVNMAVGSAPGVVALDGGNAYNSGRSRISTTGGQACKMTTLDAFWISAGRPTVQLVKVDVEGFELEVLQGAPELLATRPSFLLELTPERGSIALDRAREVLRLVAAVGYDVRRWGSGRGWIGGEVPLDRQWDLLITPARPALRSPPRGDSDRLLKSRGTMDELGETASSSRPRASIVIPAYRRTESLRALLDTLVPETASGSNIEVIVSDDGSGEEVAEVVAAYRARFPRLKYVTGENAGPGVARNRGVAAASSDVLLFVDSDCLVEPGWVDALAGAIEAGASIAFGPTRSPVPWLEPFVHSIVFEDELIGATNVAFARRTFEELGGFRADLSRLAEDRDLYTRARTAGHVPQRVADAVVNHPPRLKKIGLPTTRGDTRPLRDLRTFYQSHPSVRAQDVRSNRALLAKGTFKLLLSMTPVGLPAFVAHSLLRRRDVNRCLAEADVDFRVPASEAVKYGLLQPVNDLFRWAIQAAQMNAI